MKKGLLIILAVAMGATMLSACGAQAGKAAAATAGEERASREKAFLGIFMTDLTEEMIKEKGYKHDRGVMISGVMDDSPADEAEIEEGDIIISFDGVEIEDAEQLADEVAARKPGDRVKIELFRDGDKKRVEVELGEKEEDEWVMAWDDDDLSKYYIKMSRMGKHLGRSIGGMFAGYHWKLSGMEVSEIDGDLADYFRVDEGEGVLVTEVDEEGVAGQIGIKSGDILVEVAGEEIGSVDDLNEALDDCEDEFRVVVVRKGDRKEFEVDLDDYDTGYHIHRLPEERELRIKIPRKDIIDLKTMKLAEEYEKEMQHELQELRLKLEELKQRLEKIEKERD